MRFLDKYPECKGCPVHRECGTIISSRLLCNSYEEPKASPSDTDAFDSFVPNMDVEVIDEDDYLAWQETMQAELDAEEDIIASYHEAHPYDTQMIGEDAYPHPVTPEGIKQFLEDELPF